MNERQPRRVLLVDVDAAERAVTLRCLRATSLDLVVDEAGSAEAVRTLLAERPYACVLVDNRLPEGPAVETLAREVASNLPCPFVMVTGSGDEMTAARAFKTGFRDYLVKTALTPGNLQQAIEDACERARRDVQAGELAHRLRHTSLHDTLTGLPNRKLFDDRLRQAIAGAARCAPTTRWRASAATSSPPCCRVWARWRVRPRWPPSCAARRTSR